MVLAEGHSRRHQLRRQETHRERREPLGLKWSVSSNHQSEAIDCLPSLAPWAQCCAPGFSKAEVQVQSSQPTLCTGEKGPQRDTE